MIKNLLLSLCISGLAITALAQSDPQPTLYPNADGEILQKKVAGDPSVLGKYLIYEDNLRQLINEGPTNRTDTLINGKRIIPVVVHVIHKGGPENISRAQVEDAIALLNIDYNKLNADTTAAYSWPAFASRRADCQIEFRLAKIDPDGNCTDGIVRHYDPQTNYAYFTTMSTYAWSPSRYMNIFSVAFIYPEGITLPEGAFIGGMSPFPPSNALSQALTGGDTMVDGVLIRHDGLGSIGTATTLGGMPINALNRTFTHETGHYFNLYHPFQNMMLGLIPASSGCPTWLAPNGDEVPDTPPVDVATQNVSANCYVPGSRNTCTQDSPDEPDMIENYMDYQWGFCTNIFTNGQLDRINATLDGDRRKLWSIENLIATGVLDTAPPACAPKADFYADHFVICAGGSVNFTDQSYGVAPTSWSWTFTGGTPATSVDQNPTVQYNTPGTFSVKLVATNSNGSDSLIRNAYIIVTDPATSDTAPLVEGFEIPNLNDWVVINDVGNAWQLMTTAHYTGAKCLGITNFENNNPGSYDEIVSPVYDFTSLPSGAMPLMKFRLAYAGKYVAGTLVTDADTVYDKLILYQSVDCGATWQQKYSKSGAALATITTIPDDYLPTDTADWREEVVSLSYSSLNETDVRFKFVFYSNGGNNLYIDDINITSPWYSTPEEALAALDLNMYPNPADDATNITFTLFEQTNVKITVFDVLGREVHQATCDAYGVGRHLVTIAKDQLGGSGIYTVKVTVDDQSVNRKLVIR
jgi:PKD repeat protein